MTLDYKNIFAVAFLIAVIGVFSIIWQRPDISLGSVMPAGEYMATTTTGMKSSGHVSVVADVSGNSNLLPSTLGSIIVASSSATSFTIWNATSTTDVSSTTVAVIKASVAEGTYTFDTELTRGLIVVKPAGFNGSYVVTYRRQ